MIGTEERVVEVRYTFQIESQVSRAIYARVRTGPAKRRRATKDDYQPVSTTNKESRDDAALTRCCCIYYRSCVIDEGEKVDGYRSIARRERIIAIANRNADYRRDRLQRGNIGAKSHRVASPISFESIRRIFDCERSVENSVGSE